LSLLGGEKPRDHEAEKVEVPSIHFPCNVRYFHVMYDLFCEFFASSFFLDLCISSKFFKSVLASCRQLLLSERIKVFFVLEVIYVVLHLFFTRQHVKY
jgi:hypothetical protein